MTRKTSLDTISHREQDTPARRTTEQSLPWQSLTTLQPSRKIKTKTHVVPAAHGYAFEVPAGSYFRIVDLHGQQVVDFMAWRLPYAPGVNTEHFSASYTRNNLESLGPPEVGEGLFSNHDRQMFTVTADMVKTHDMLYMACNPGFYARRNQPDHRSCATNIAEAMRAWGMQHWTEVVDPFNVFQNTPYYTLKGLNCSRPGDYIEMRAEMPVVCAVSSCPFDENGFNAGNVTDIAIVTEVTADDD